MGVILREFDEYQPRFSDEPKPRWIIASPQFLRNSKFRFKKGFEHFLNELQEFMIEQGICQIYLSLSQWDVMTDR